VRLRRSARRLLHHFGSLAVRVSGVTVDKAGNEYGTTGRLRLLAPRVRRR
jgi:hypothetical protein